MSEANPRPQPPGDHECCESGCSRCVWDSYYDAMREWQEKEKAAKAAREQAASDAAN